MLLKKVGKKNLPVVGIYFIFIVLLFIQYRNVYMYYDDFAYATLSYVYEVPGIKGTNFTFFQLMEFLYNHYNLWGGRVLGYLIYILLLKMGLYAIRIANVISLFLIFLFEYKIVKTTIDETNKTCWKLALFTCCLFGFFSVDTYRIGVYWYASSSTYIFGNIYLIVGSYKYWNYLKTAKKNIAEVIFIASMFFFAGWSMEQVGFGAIVVVVALTITNYIENRKIKKSSIIICLSALIGYIMLLIAPGNYKRLDTNNSATSFINKILLAMNNITNNMFSKENVLLVILISFTVIGVSILLRETKDKIKVKIAYIGLIAAPISVILTILNIFHPIIAYLYILFISIEFVIYLKDTKDSFILAYLFGAIGTQIVMIAAPYYVASAIVPFGLLWFVIASYIFRKLHEEIINRVNFNHIMNIVTMLVVGIFVCSYYTEFSGYYNNRYINEYNEKTLRMASEKAILGEDIKKVNLIPLDEKFSQSMPNNIENNPTTENGMKKYYNIPNNIIFNYTKQFDMLGGIDYYKYDCEKDILEVIGWGSITNTNSKDNKIKIELISETNEYIFDVNKVQREDVANFYNNNNYKDSGYALKLAELSKKITPGRYNINVLIENVKLDVQSIVVSGNTIDVG